MILTDTNRDLLNALYGAAIEFRDLRPWQWMRDSDIFGVKDPESDITGYCCVMGKAGEMHALAVYTGPEGLATYFRLADPDRDDDMIAALRQKLLMVSFEDRDDLEDRDRQQVQALNFKFRGKRQWVMFRDYEPGYAPWFINEQQARFLLRVLGQAIEVSKRCQENPTLLRDREDILVRVPEIEGADIHWSDEYRPVPELPETEALSPDQKRVEETLEQLPKIEKTALCGITVMPGPMRQDANNDMERPFFAHLALMLDYESEMIADQHVFSPAEMNASFQEWFLQSLAKGLGGIPSTLLVPNKFTGDLIVDIADALNIELLYAPNEPAFQEITQYLFEHLGG